jgi:hypothetical protein
MSADRDVDTIFDRYFSNVTPEQFKQDLAEFSPGTSTQGAESRLEVEGAATRTALGEIPASNALLERELADTKHRLAEVELRQMRLEEVLADALHSRVSRPKTISSRLPQNKTVPTIEKDDVKGYKM